MKPIQVSQDIIPLAEFKARVSSVFRTLRDSQRPVIVTLNGKPAGVLVGPEEFDRMQERQAFLGAIAEGMGDVREGRVVSDSAMRRELRERFGTHS
ncbi:MAG: type II toxin-antitoxin system Phd/YefM family antitoxin [Planctomycetes bacterium]|nr:type II toxin-antitoxin system Phd/YefM family antitoxin [Planctomycetota bacterium]